MPASSMIFALFLFSLSLFVCQQSVVIGIGTLRQPGSGLLPLIAGIATGILVLVSLFQSIASKEHQTEVPIRETVRKGRICLIGLSLFSYTVGVEWLGFVFSTFIFVLFLLYIIECGRIWHMGLKAAVITAGNYFIFVVWLGLPLPRGSLIW